MKRWHLFGALTSALAMCTGAQAAGLQLLQQKPEARLDKTSVPATGKQEARLMVSGFGRYSVTVTSAQGTSLQLVDHQSGPGDVSGLAGSENGRLDVFLDRGTFKIRAMSSERGSGEASLAVHAFRELNSPQPPRLIKHKLVSETLADFDQRSYWLEVPEDQEVAIEAAGRYLADLRLWKDGTWLVDAVPQTEVIEPKSGQPLLACRLSVPLEKGLYLLTAYGGPTQAWANDSPSTASGPSTGSLRPGSGQAGRAEAPFYLRLGIPPLPAAGRRRFVMSPFGYDRWQAPPEADFFRLELPEVRPAALELNESSFGRDGYSSEITKESRLPVAEVSASRGRNVTITAEAGRPYVLQQFGLLPQPTFMKQSGEFWLSTQSAGDPGDSIDATLLVTRNEDEGKPEKVYAANVVEVDLGKFWARRFNSLETSTLLLHVAQPGVYAIAARESEAVFRVAPFLLVLPEKYQAPPFKPSGTTFELDPGYYVLTIQPVQKGIISVAFCAARMLGDAQRLLERPEELARRPMLPSAQIPKLAMEGKRFYRVHRNTQPDVESGTMLRKLPLDLKEALPFVQQPGTTLPVPFATSEPGTLYAETEGGGQIEVSVDNGPWQSSVDVAPGRHVATVRSSSVETLRCSLFIVPKLLRADTPLPALPETALQSMPRFETLSEGSPVFFDLAAPPSHTATFIVEARGPGLYELQSTGILSTAGRLRTRTIPSLFEATSNGVGRNFLIQQYLREGDYQVTVAAQEEMEGHLGLELRRSEIIDGGALVEGIPARIELPAGAAVAYRFKVGEERELRFQSLGLGRNFRCRLEDSEGWPVAEPDSPSDFTRSFEPGEYRVILLPDAVASRRVTLLEAVPAALEFKGHGPHKLPLAERIEHQWLEPEEGADRVPDAWAFELPAPAKVTIGVTSQMQGRLLRSDRAGKWIEAAAIPVEGWNGQLEPGTYRIELRCVRVNNRVDYQVEVRPTELLAGRTIEVSAPTSVPVSLGEAALIELSSFGASDVRGRLYDAQGKLVTESDDRPQDWNFQILQRLVPGQYRLEVQPIGTESADCSISMRLPRETVDAKLALPGTRELSVGQEAHLVPLEVDAAGGLLLLGAESPELMGLSVEVSDGPSTGLRLFVPSSANAPEGQAQDGASGTGGWRPLETAVGTSPRLEVPLFGSSASQVRLRIWSLDGRGSTMRLSVASAAPTILSETELASGVPLEPIPGTNPSLGAIAVRVDRPGVFQLGAGSERLRVSAASGEACEEIPGGSIPADDVIWLVGALDPGMGTRVAQMTRSRVETGGRATAPLVLPDSGRAAWDLNAGERGPVLAIATSITGDPGVRVVDRATEESMERDGAGMAPAGRSTISVALEAAEPAALLWRTKPSLEKTEVRVAAWAYPVPDVQPAQLGEWSGALSGLRGQSYELPAVPKRIRLSLGSSLVAVLSEGKHVRSVHWRNGESFAETLDASASTNRLTLLHMREEADFFAVEMLTSDSNLTTPLAISTTTSLQVDQPTAGRIRVAVTAPAEKRPSTGSEPAPDSIRGRTGTGATGTGDSGDGTTGTSGTTGPTGDAGASGARMRFFGSVRNVLFLRDDGSILRGTDIELTRSGVAVVEHGPGTLMGWLEHTGEPSEALWGQAPTGGLMEIAGPSVIALQGVTQSFRLKLAPGRVAHFRSSTPAIALVRHGDTPGEATAQLDGIRVDAYAPAGPVQVHFRGVAGRALSGSVSITMTDVISVDEGLGPEVLLPPGGTRFFSFEVNAPGPVGIGVRADSGSIHCDLLDRDARFLSSGVVQMSELERGAHLIRLHAPEDGPPVLARVALAGLKAPGKGPPEDVVREYLKLAKEPVSAASDDATETEGEEGDPDEEVRDEEREQP